MKRGIVPAALFVLLLELANSQWGREDEMTFKCQNGKVPIAGFCTRDTDNPLHCVNIPYVCDEKHSFPDVDTGTFTTICGRFGTSLSCPDGTAVVGSCVSTRNKRCGDSGCDTSITCRSNLQTGVRSEACRWVSSEAHPELTCLSDEVVAGMCVPSEIDPIKCEDTWYMKFGVRIRCCLSDNTQCAPPATWSKSLVSTCPQNSAVGAICSYNCDPQGVLSENTTKNVPVMYLCQGLYFTEPSDQLTSCTSQWATCPASSIVVAVSDRSCPVGRVRAVCRKTRFMNLYSCQTLYSNEYLWCPYEFVMTEICTSPLGQKLCNGYQSAAVCCAVLQHYKGGTPCATNWVYTFLGDVYSRGSVPSGIGNGFSGVALRGPNDERCYTCVTVLAAEVFGSTMYVMISQNGPPSMGVVLSINLDYGQSPNLNYVFGSYTSGEYTSSGQNADGWWYSRDTPLGIKSDANLRVYANTGRLMISEIQTGIFRDIDLTYNSWTVFRERIWTGIPGRPQGTYSNNLPRLSSEYTDVAGFLYRPSEDLYLFSSARAIVYYGYFGYTYGYRMRYYCGNGNEPTDYQRRYRTSQPVSRPGTMVLSNDAVIYFAEMNAGLGSSIDTAIIQLDLSNGYVEPVPVTPPLNNPRSIVLYQPPDASEHLRMYVVGNGLLSVVDMQTGYSQPFSAGEFSQGLNDRTPAEFGTYRTPQGLSVSDTHLYIADRQNARVRAILLTKCPRQFSNSDKCRSCASNYFYFPACRNICTIEHDCNGRATSVSGYQPGHCYCTCKELFVGRYCTSCKPGLDPNYNCAVCLKGHVKWPECRTSTPTLELTSTASPRISDTLTISLAQSISPTFSPSEEPTSSETRTILPTQSHTDVLTWSASDSLQASPSLSPASTLTYLATETETVHYPPTRTPSATETIYLSFTEELAMTHTVAETASTSHSLTPPPTNTFTTTATPNHYVTATATPSLIPPDVTTGPHETQPTNITLPPESTEESTTAFPSGSPTNDVINITTQAPPTTLTPQPTTKNQTRNESGSVSITRSISLRRPQKNDNSSDPNFTTTMTSYASLASETELQTQPPSELPEDTEPPTHIPTTTPTDLPIIVVKSVVTGRVSAQAVMKNGPEENRRIDIAIFEARFNITQCTSPGALEYVYPLRYDLRFLDFGISRCNSSHLRIVFPFFERVDAVEEISVGVRLDRILEDGQQHTAKFVIEPLSPTLQGAREVQVAASYALLGCGAAARDIQGLAIVGMVSCGKPEARSLAASARVVLCPWKIIDDDELGRLLGNFVLLLIGGIVVGSGFFGVLFASEQSDHILRVSDPTETPLPVNHLWERHFRSTMSTLFLPGKYLMWVGILHQGICFEAYTLLLAPGISFHARCLGGVAALYGMAVPAALYFWWFRTYFVNVRCFQFKYAIQSRSIVAKALMPSVYWTPLFFNRSFGDLFGMYRGGFELFGVVYDPFLKSNIIAAIAALHVDPGAQCCTQFIVLLLIYGAEGVFRLIKWPATTFAGNFAPISACFSLLIIGFNSFSPFMIISSELLLLLQSWLCVTFGVITMVVLLVDAMISQKYEIRARCLRQDFAFSDCSGNEIIVPFPKSFEEVQAEEDMTLLEADSAESDCDEWETEMEESLLKGNPLSKQFCL